jgi:hypothetical protein
MISGLRTGISKIFKAVIFAIVFLAPFILIVYTFLIKNGYLKYSANSQPFELFADMDNQKKVLPLSKSEAFSDKASIRKPVEHTYSLNSARYSYESIEFALAEKEFDNPLISDSNIILFAKNRFNTFCIYCHGVSGQADGSVLTKTTLKENEEGFPSPPILTRTETKAMSDARLFHIISAGQNLMFSAADKLTVTERWALVLYIRELQKTK